MVYNPWLHRTAPLLIVGMLVLSTFTNVLAQPAGADALEQPLPITTNAVFMPLVQSDTEIDVKGEDSPAVDMAIVELVALFKIDAAPVQINAAVRGYLPNDCLEISKIQQLYTPNQILLNLITRPRLDKRLCANVPTAFEETVSLDLIGLAAGEYRVVVQTVEAGFTLTAADVAPNKVYMPLVSG